MAKPATRRVTPEGRVTFVGHDAVGAEMAAGVLARLRASERLREHVAALTRHHLRLGFLVHEMPLGRRAIYRYLRACEPVQVDVTLLSVADRLATRGRGVRGGDRSPPRARARAVGRGARLAHRARPRPPLRGDELATGGGPAARARAGAGFSPSSRRPASRARSARREQAIERAREMVGGRARLSLER